jgi:hypothetical protein
MTEKDMTKQVEQVARYAERMQQQATQVGNSATKYNTWGLSLPLLKT